MNTNYQGIGMCPRPNWEHQSLCALIHVNTYKELSCIGLRMFVEATVTENWNDRTPDLVVFDKYMTPKLIIEITTHKEVKKNVAKCNELLVRFPSMECFVYDYGKEELLMFDFETCAWISSFQYELFPQYLEKPMLDYFV